MEIKLIATDLDGTFLDDHKQFLDANIQAFRECAEKGIHIVPATGRTIIGVPEEIKNLLLRLLLRTSCILACLCMRNNASVK